MPTISETGDNGNDGAMEDNNFEQLMVNMLDERDKLMETLREAQENLAYTRNKLKETELEKDALLQKFEILLSEVCILHCFLVCIQLWLCENSTLVISACQRFSFV